MCGTGRRHSVTKMKIAFWRKERIGGEADRGLPGHFQVDDMTMAHVDVLREIKSPFVVYNGENRAKYIDALRGVSVMQIAEFTFVISRPVAETRAMLARGRSVLADTAMHFVLQAISLPMLQQIEAHPELLVAAIRMPGQGGAQKR